MTDELWSVNCIDGVFIRFAFFFHLFMFIIYLVEKGKQGKQHIVKKMDVDLGF